MIRERPGLAPAALFHLIGHTVFLRLADVASGLPPYTEQVRLVDLADASDETGYSQRSAYQAVFTTLRKSLAAALATAPSGYWAPTCRRCWPTPMAAPAARRSSIPRPPSRWCRSRP